jgi:hypothetical protein
MKKLNFFKLIAPVFLIGFLVSCSDDDDVVPTAPTTYTFERGGVNTVSYVGQTTRLMQADELYAALNNASSTEAALDLMFGGDSSGSAGFANPDLNGTSKIIRSKTSAYANTASNLSVFDGWLAEFANDVAPNLGGAASPGVAGDFDGYQLNAAGQELDQLFFKSLIGAFALDQIVNNTLRQANWILAPDVMITLLGFLKMESLTQLWSINGMKVLVTSMVKLQM